MAPDSLAQEPQPPGPQARRRPWRVVALIAVLGVLLLSSYTSLRGERAQRIDSSLRLYLQSTLEARQLYALEHLGDHGQQAERLRLRTRVLGDMGKIADATGSRAALRRLAVMQRYLGEPGWKATLGRLRSLPGAPHPFAAEQELDVWRRAYETPSVEPAAVPALVRSLRGFGLGWYAHPALEVLYNRAGMRAEAHQETLAALASLTALVALALAAGLIGLAGTVIGGAAALYLLWRRKHPMADMPYALEQLTGQAALPASDHGGRTQRARRTVARAYHGAMADLLLPLWRLLVRAVRIAPPAPLAPDKAAVLYAAFLAYLTAFAVIRLLAGPIVRAILTDGGDISPTASMAVSFALSVASLAAPLAVLVSAGRRAGLRASDIGLQTRAFWTDVAWGIGGYAAALPVLALSIVFSSWLFRGFETPTNPAAAEFIASPGMWVRILLFAQAAALAPFAEELMFRGVFFRSLTPRVGWVLALLTASGVFALLHPQLPLGFLSILALGATFNLLYALRGSLLPNMLAHAVNNGLIFCVLLLILGD